MQTILIELARLSITTQQTVCRNLLDGVGQAGDHSVLWIEQQLDIIPFIPETHRRWMEEWVCIGKEGNNNLKNNLNDLFEGANALLSRLGK